MKSKADVSEPNSRNNIPDIPTHEQHALITDKLFGSRQQKKRLFEPLLSRKPQITRINRNKTGGTCEQLITPPSL